MGFLHALSSPLHGTHMTLRLKLSLALTAIAALCAASPSTANRLFKCTDAAGNTVYQQNSCDADAKEETRTFVREEPAPPPLDAPYADQVERYSVLDRITSSEDYVDRPAYASPNPSTSRPTGVYRDRFGTVIDSRSAAAEELRRAQSRSDTREGRRLNRAIYGTDTPQAGDVLPESGLSRGPRYTAPPATQNQNATQVGSRVVTDQYGNRYEGAQGSHFVTDPRTGKQCLAVGNTINCNL
jgi:hypothetical protein